MFSILNYIRRRDLIFFILFGVIIGNTIIKSVYLAVLPIVMIVIILYFRSKPLKTLSLLVPILPFTGIELFHINLINLPGTKLLNMLAVFVMLIAIINYHKCYKMQSFAIIFVLIYITIFSVSLFRSISNLDIINAMIMSQERDKLSTLNYLLSYYVKPIIYFMPLIIIIHFANVVEDIEYLINLLIFSLTALSIYLLYIYIFETSDKTDIAQVVESTSLALGLHKNAVATFYILGFPLILSKFFLKKTIISIASMALCIAAIGFLFSRTAYITLIFSFILYLIISKRAKLFPVIIVIGFLVSYMISSTIIERAGKGLESKDANTVLAGRVEGFWLPLISEYTQDPKKLLFGNGRFGILSTNAYSRGILIDAAHPHNMYLEQVLDSGIIGLISLMAIFMGLFKKIWSMLKSAKDATIKEYNYGLFVSLSCYFVAGLSGRTMFPAMQNGFFWVIMGAAFVIMRILDKSGEKLYEKT